MKKLLLVVMGITLIFITGNCSPNETSISINIENDRNGMIEGAFTKAVLDAGLSVGVDSSSYALNVEIITEEIDRANSIFVHIYINAYLVDLNLGETVLAYNFNYREGHFTLQQAELRAYRAAERKINDEFCALLTEYFNK